MATPVNPPPFLRVPRAFEKDLEVKAFIENQNTILFQLWRRGGGSNDDLAELIETVNNIIESVADLTIRVDANELNIATNSSAIAANKNYIQNNSDRITVLEGDVLTSIVTSVNTTATGNSVVSCTNTLPIEITLNPTPADAEIVYIKRTNGPVDIIGTIDGLTNLTINIVNYSVTVFYNGINWVQI